MVKALLVLNQPIDPDHPENCSATVRLQFAAGCPLALISAL